MNALQKIKLSKELLATTASLKGGQLKALEKIKASKRALEIVTLLSAHAADVAAKNAEYEAQQVEDARKIEDEKQAAIAAKEKAAKDRQDALESTQEWKVLASVADIEKVKQSLETMNRITMNYSKGKAISKDDSKAYDAAQYSLYQVSQNLESIGWNGTGLLKIRKASYKKNKPFFLGDVLKMDKVAGEESEQSKEYDGYIKIAADSIAELRLVDVERVLSESGLKGEELSAFGDYIIKNRPDLEGEVNDLVGEMFSGGTRQPKDKDFTPLLNSIINGDVSAFDDSTKLTELVDAVKESGGGDMPEDKKGLFIEAIKAAGVQVLIGKGFRLAA